MEDHTDVDRWIEQLLQCKPLSEKEVEALCEKVRCSWHYTRLPIRSSLLLLSLSLLLLFQTDWVN
jgi:hypothetical protein